jgi:aldehyde dehydrogenase (NAD+)
MFFYTGNIPVGRIIYEMAAKQLIPVTLELGGKSPCIVESDAKINIAAKELPLQHFLMPAKCAWLLITF